MTYNNSMVFIETTHFTHWISRYLKDEEYSELQSYLMEYPEAGGHVKDEVNQEAQGLSITGQNHVVRFIC
jgi:hypothetical protein